MAFTLTDLVSGDFEKLSVSDRMSIEFGGPLSLEGRQFLRDAMSLELGGCLSPDGQKLISNAMSREFGGAVTPLPEDSIYRES